VRRKSVARRTVMVLALAMIVGACARDDGTVPPSASASLPGPASAIDGESIYDLDLALTDQEGARLTLADLRGRTLVAAMMYSSCTSVCPRITQDMKGIEKQLSARNRPDVGFVLFSLDPGRDTPDALRQFASAHALSNSRWRLFTASEDGVRDLAAVLGVKYKAEEGGEIAHSAMIFVIDRNGVVRHRQVGLNQDASGLISALAQAGG
jgi:protein SCO1/2